MGTVIELIDPNFCIVNFFLSLFSFFLFVFVLFFLLFSSLFVFLFFIYPFFKGKGERVNLN